MRIFGLSKVTFNSSKYSVSALHFVVRALAGHRSKIARFTCTLHFILKPNNKRFKIFFSLFVLNSEP